MLLYLCFQLLLSLAHVSASPLALEDRDAVSSLDRRAIGSTSALHRLRSPRRVSSPRSQYGQAKIISVDGDLEFATNISIGTHEYSVILDTGSSDTWFVESGFTCVNLTNNATLKEPDCYFGKSYQPDKAFVPIPDENFNISYADGEYLNGVLGFDTVTFAGVKVAKQTVALVDLAAWEGDGITSGLMGLAYPAATHAYPGTNVTTDIGVSLHNHSIVTNKLPYSTIINTMFFVENLTKPEFSVAISRDKSGSNYGGLLAVGGIPHFKDPRVNATSHIYGKAPLEVPTLAPQKKFYWYTISIDAVQYPKSKQQKNSTLPTQYIVDTGTTVNYVPSSIAKAYNSHFDPPAQNIEGFYYVECNATVPHFDVVIGGVAFGTNSYDLIASLGEDTCVSGVQDAGNGQNVLGDVFLRNVLAVFNVGQAKMEFLQQDVLQIMKRTFISTSIGRRERGSTRPCEDPCSWFTWISTNT